MFKYNSLESKAINLNQDRRNRPVEMCLVEIILKCAEDLIYYYFFYL